MMAWCIALAVAGAAAWLAYGREPGHATRLPTWLLAVLRAGALLLITALLLDAPMGLARRVAPVVAIDASASWRRAAGNDSTRVQQLRRVWDSVAAQAAEDGAVVAFGDSVRSLGRAGIRTLLPADAATRLRPVIDRAAALGRPVVLVTDGGVDEPEAFAEALPGSRVIVWPSADRPDAGLVDLAVPSAAQAGDTLTVSVVLTAGAGGVPAGSLALRLDGTDVAQVPVPPLASAASTRVTVPVPLGRGARTTLLEAVLRIAGDLEPRNDTLRAAIEVTDAPAAVVVSTAPDLDVREVLTVLRGALAIPARAYLRVAPGQWREEGNYAAVREEDVRTRVRAAGMVLIHGDTLWGAIEPQARRRQARALWAPAPPTAVARAGEIARAPEWFPAGAPLSPLSAALAGIPWDSVPPITVTGPVEGGMPVLTFQQARSGVAVAGIALQDSGGARTVRVSGSGYAGWALRGGRSAQAFAALWGTLFDWLAAGRGDTRAARPVAPVRAGEPVRWLRGTQDSLVTLTVRRRQTPASAATGRGGVAVRVLFAAGAAESVSPPVPPGVYDVEGGGGTSVLVVNPSREWIPAPPAVRAGPARAGEVQGIVPRLRDAWWPFVAALVLLCAEWVARRVRGLR